jgi:hypothetical protein
MEKLCLECGKPLGAGRSDRRFCNEACKTKFHNNQKIFEYAEIKKIENILKRNRRVLKRLLGDEREKVVSYEKLLKLGFEFGYYTHHRKSAVKKYEYTYCFDYGYRIADDASYKIVKAYERKDE